MINIAKVFNELRELQVGIQKKLPINDCVLKVFCAISIEGKSRLSILTRNPTGSIESTKSLRIIQGKESEGVYWTCFELQDNGATNVFYSLCSDLINSVLGFTNEKDALVSLANRYYAWRVMFRRSNHLSEEKIKGLFGELYFLSEYMIPKYGVSVALDSWSGTDGTNKDFSINNTWYEIKTISTNSLVVKISSLSQLSSNVSGQLCVIRTEIMSQEYDDGKCSLNDMFRLIIDRIETNEDKEKFMTKLIDYGFDITDGSMTYKLKVDSISRYLVNDGFPRLVEDDVKFEEIGGVTYEMILRAIEKYRIEE